MTLIEVPFEIELDADFEGLAKDETKIIKVSMLPCTHNCKDKHQWIIYHIHKVDVQWPERRHEVYKASTLPEIMPDVFSNYDSLQRGQVVASSDEHHDQFSNSHEVFSFAFTVLDGISSNFINTSSQSQSRSLAISLARKAHFQKSLEKAVL